MKILFTFLSILAMSKVAWSNKYLPSHLSRSSASFGGFSFAGLMQLSRQYPTPATGSSGGSTFGSVGIATPARKYLSPAVTGVNGADPGISSGISSFNALGSNFGYAAGTQPSRKYLTPCAHTSHASCNGFATSGFGAGNTGYGSVAPAAFPAHAQATGIGSNDDYVYRYRL